MERWGKYWLIYYGVFLAVLARLLWHYPYALDWQNESRLLLLAGILGVSAGTALIFTIVAEVLGRMVLLIPPAARLLTKKARDEGKAEGVAEGVAKGRAEVLAWVERRDAAERDGLPFNEPPPG